MKKFVIVLFSIFALLFFSLSIFCEPLSQPIKHKLKNGTYRSNDQEINWLLDCIDAKVKNDLDDRGSCVYDLISLKPEAKLVLPKLLDHMANDSDENIKRIIADQIVNVSDSQEVKQALRKIMKTEISEEYIIKQKKKFKNWNELNSLPGLALRSLASINDEESIPLIVSWTAKYDIDVLDFRSKREVVDNGAGKLNDRFISKCNGQMDLMLKTPNVTNLQKLSLIKSKIISLHNDPNKFVRFFSNALNDNDQNVKIETLNKLNDIKHYDSSTGQTNSKKLIEALKKDLDKMRGEKFDNIRKQILENN